jgi:preprotein translocase subunit SecE
MAKSVAIVEAPITGMDRLKSGPARLGEFLKDVRAEMKKVITPTRAEVQATTIVVIATVFMFAVFFAVVDFFVGHGIDMVFKYLAKT